MVRTDYGEVVEGLLSHDIYLDSPEPPAFCGASFIAEAALSSEDDDLEDLRRPYDLRSCHLGN